MTAGALALAGNPLLASRGARAQLSARATSFAALDIQLEIEMIAAVE